MDALRDVAPLVFLASSALHERLWDRALDADENREEVRVLHRLQQLVVICDMIELGLENRTDSRAL